MHDQPSVPYGFCHCGCGQRTNRARQTDRKQGYVRGEPYAFCVGHGSRKRNVPACGWVEEDRGYVTPCRIWQLTINRDGYGMVHHRGSTQGAHVVLWVEEHGPVPDGHELDHLCRQRPCVRTDHLEPVTHAVNGQRGALAKFKPADVLAIRAASLTPAVLARLYGVEPPTIHAIIDRKTWRNIEEPT